MYREVAQLGGALALGARGRRFDSCLPDMIYRHSKTGHLYELLHENAKHSETLELMCVYKRIDDGQVWVRPKAMYFETVIIDGIAVLRFEPELEEMPSKPRC